MAQSPNSVAERPAGEWRHDRERREQVQDVNRKKLGPRAAEILPRDREQLDDAHAVGWITVKATRIARYRQPEASGTRW